MNILGFSGITRGSYYEQRYGIRFIGHDSSVVLIQDGKVTFAVEEERFSREKHTSQLPIEGLGWGLKSAGIELGDIDAVAYTWNASFLRRVHMYAHHPLRIPAWHWPALAMTGTRVLRDLMEPKRVAKTFARELGQPLPRIHGVSHHLCHSACAYLTSPFEEAATLTVDGQGEDESATLAEWRGTEYTQHQCVYSPDSIGILYGMVTDFLGMRAGWDEYKVMGMASLGDPRRFSKQLDRLVTLRPKGRYRTFRTAMVFKPGYCDLFLERMIGIPKRNAAAALDQIHFDLAASLQAKLEEVIFHLLKRLREVFSSNNLCLGGGVFLNSVVNGKIKKSGLFDNVYVPPVPGDHGCALGAALLTYHKLSGDDRCSVEFNPFSGPGYSESQIERVLQENSLTVQYSKSDDIVEEAAERLARGEVVGWFQGRCEYGPRALGHRSILANPLQREMKDIVNERIKHREDFRPFAGSVPAERATQYFDIAGDSPFMQFVLPVLAHTQSQIPAVVHQGTCRAQTVTQKSDALFHSLLHTFGRLTGVPVLLNTSFNDRDEPIVCSPEDAVRTFLSTDLDALAIGSFLVLKA